MKKIIGIGNALVDAIVNLPDEQILDTFSLPKGGMEMIDIARKRELHAALSAHEVTLASGGSTANTIHGIARLGSEAGFVGKVGNDEMGRFFASDMQKSGITPHLIRSETVDTGIATTLMTRDAERTFATYLGAAATMTPAEITTDILKPYDYIHVEGYLIFNRDLILRTCQMAKENQMRISMDMASYNLVKENHDFIQQLLENYVDIVFANEEEARAFTDCDDEAALDILSQICDVAVVKMGGRGSVADIHGTRIRIGTNGKAPLDTNGAGDAYAAGFLYGLMHGLSPEKTVNLAARLGDAMVSTIGAKLSDNQWNNIRKERELF